MTHNIQIMLFAVLILFFVLSTLFFSVNFKSREEKNKEERDKEKTAEQKKDEALQTLGLSITRSLMLYVADKETFFGAWNLGTMNEVDDIVAKAIANIKNDELDCPAVDELMRIIDITLKQIATKLEKEDHGLFDQLKGSNAELKKMVAAGDEGSMSKKMFDSMTRMSQDLDKEISQAEKFFNDIIKYAIAVGLPIVDPVSYRYRWYYVLQIPHRSYLDFE